MRMGEDRSVLGQREVGEVSKASSGHVRLAGEHVERSSDLYWITA